MKTTQTAGAARAQIETSFTDVAGRAPTPEELGMLLAHSAGETARWRSMYCWNYGFTTTLGSHDWFVLPGNPLHFRAFDDAPTGCRDWLEMLRDSFPQAWAELGSGDPAAYVRGLVQGRAGSYFGNGSPEAYERLVAGLYREYLPLAQGGAATASQRAPRGKAAWLLPLRLPVRPGAPR